MIQFDKLKMYFGEPYHIQTPDGGGITVLQPTIGQIVSIGENRFYSTLNTFITNTTSYRAVLWDAGIDWNEITDFDLFILLYKTVDPEIINILFENIDFAKFNIAKDNDGQMVLLDADTGIVIDGDVYEHFHRYLQEVFKMKPEDEFTDDPLLKKWWTDKDRRKSQREEKQEKETYSIISIISALVNHPGFKYKLNELKEVGVCQFYDSVQRLQIYEASTAIMKGMYSGFVDGSKIKSENYNWMRNI